ncbi:family 20 glycosylhydrolase [Pendulispora albinea]|uniref:beta-N-acetylhexosaminidase n=1 Tax=Pendulispora albinea TaxID=2741071 RepID=A0ABZ2M5X5_9BACT
MTRSLLGISTIVASAWIAGCQGDAGVVSQPETEPGDLGASESGESRESSLQTRASGPDIAITFRPVDNTAADDGSFFRGELTIENRSGIRLDASGWQIYFSFVRRILNDGEGNATYKQNLAAQGLKVQKGGAARSGEYFVLEPLANFVPIPPGGKRVIPFLAENWAIVKTDAPGGFHIVFPPSTQAWALKASTVWDASDPKQTKRFPGDVVPTQTPALRYEENAPLDRVDLDPASSLIPRPKSVTTGSGQYRLGGKIGIDYQRGLAKEANYLKSALGDVLAGSVETHERSRCGSEIRLVLDPQGSFGAEGYSLSIDPEKGIEIRGADSAGVFYGIQTLRQLVPVDAYQAATRPGGKKTSVQLPEIDISDTPLFSYRGMMLDVGRHFQSKQTVKKLLDVLAFHKINKFHFRLTEDEGWRLEIPGIPELTTFGARRGYDPDEKQQLHQGFASANDLGGGDNIQGKARNETEANGGKEPTYQGFEQATLNYVGKGSGFYTTKEFEEILAYATERHIDVIPEIDVPGHARAAVRSMEHRYAKYAATDPVKASQYRLADPNDTSKHTSVQGYTDNFVNPCLSSSYAFLAKVVREIKARYDAVPGAKLTLIHGGGDELPSLSNNVWWQGSPLCKANPETKDLGDEQLKDHFFKKFHPIITATGARMTGWDDIIHNGLQLEGFVPMPWSNVWQWGREDDAYKYANEGRSVILSHATNLYMDLAYNKDPDEPGYYWANFVDDSKTFNYLPFDVFAIATHNRMGHPIAPSEWDNKVRLTAAGRANVLGMHGLLFAENVKSPELVEYFAFPKILGVAERAWNTHTPTAADLPAAWKQFVNTLGQAALPRLDFYRPVDVRRELPRSTGINYRIPLPGAKVVNGQLLANVRYPGFNIEYSTNNGATFVPYTGPTGVSGTVLVRAKALNGHVGRTAKVN